MWTWHFVGRIISFVIVTFQRILSRPSHTSQHGRSKVGNGYATGFVLFQIHFFGQLFQILLKLLRFSFGILRLFAAGVLKMILSSRNDQLVRRECWFSHGIRIGGFPLQSSNGLGIFILLLFLFHRIRWSNRPLGFLSILITTIFVVFGKSRPQGIGTHHRNYQRCLGRSTLGGLTGIKFLNGHTIGARSLQCRGLKKGGSRILGLSSSRSGILAGGRFLFFLFQIHAKSGRTGLVDGNK
mmetsp:Transcript_3620/g.7548  ORF Transcript_3620/g.7548 Transcript_3620/m.7548 type:complete len:240 (-) Transcript_3620:66-785(-)